MSHLQPGLVHLDHASWHCSHDFNWKNNDLNHDLWKKKLKENRNPSKTAHRSSVWLKSLNDHQCRTHDVYWIDDYRKDIPIGGWWSHRNSGMAKGLWPVRYTHYYILFSLKINIKFELCVELANILIDVNITLGTFKKIY